MSVIGKGDLEMYEEVERLGLNGYFIHVEFVKGDKNPTIFRPHVDKTDPKKTLVVGDRTRGEIEVGNALGTTTVWVKQGRFVEETPENPQQNPNFQVNSLLELLNLLSS